MVGLIYDLVMELGGNGYLRFAAFFKHIGKSSCLVADF